MQRKLITNKTESLLSSDNQINLTTVAAPKNVDILRKLRSKKYVETLSKLDSGEIHLDESLKDELIEEIKNEFGNLEVNMWPLGIVAKCYLGDDFEVHTLDLTLKIVKHYKYYESLPQELEKARNIANNKNYAFIEVYSNMLKAISHDGTVSEIIL